MRAVHALALLALAAAAPLATMADESTTTIAEDTERVASDPSSTLGETVSAAALDDLRGGDEDIVTNVIRVTGDVSGNSATDIATGANTIREGSFADASGLTTVVQNTGANVLIQNATIVNIQFVDP